jgi:DNA adenine methylase
MIGQEALFPRPGMSDVVLVPPIKCQGIKTKLVPFIRERVTWVGRGRWVEPFVGSGVVAFSLLPDRALLADANPHIIAFYRAVQGGQVTPYIVRAFLEEEGARLRERGEDHYYAVRERFNAEPNPLDFLFLNRSCFNGLMRFNRRGAFNVPFNRKPERFAPAYVTKVVNQVARVDEAMDGRDWIWVVDDWRLTLDRCEPADFVYADPPYSGRFSDYFNRWGDEESVELCTALVDLPCEFAMSTWVENRYRRNALVDVLPDGTGMATTSHFYHLGATESLRNEVIEGLVLREAAVAG